MFLVCVGTDQNFVSLIVLSQLQSRGVSSGRIDVGSFREALHHVIEHRAFGFVMQIFRGHEITVDSFRLAVDAGDQLPTIMFRFPVLSCVSHHRTHATTCLTTFVIREAYDCHGHHRCLSAISRTAVRMSARSCRTSLRLMTVTFPMCASVTS